MVELQVPVKFVLYLLFFLESSVSFVHWMQFMIQTQKLVFVSQDLKTEIIYVSKNVINFSIMIWKWRNVFAMRALDWWTENVKHALLVQALTLKHTNVKDVGNINSLSEVNVCVWADIVRLEMVNVENVRIKDFLKLMEFVHFVHKTGKWWTDNADVKVEGSKFMEYALISVNQDSLLIQLEIAITVWSIKFLSITNVSVNKDTLEVSTKFVN